MSEYVPEKVSKLRREAQATRAEYLRLRDEAGEAKHVMERVHRDLNEEERRFDLPVTACPSSLALGPDWIQVDETLFWQGL